MPPLRLLVLQHLPVEHPGSFREIIAEQGHDVTVVELDAGERIPPADGFDVMLVMGGPQDVWQEAQYPWLRDEKAAIAAWVSAGKPYLGICLGAQLLADAMGGAVALMPGKPEVGVSTIEQTESGRQDPIFRDVPPVSRCFQWHGAEITRLPPGARLIATAAGCRVQALAVGPHAYGLQYHLELTDTTDAEWAAEPAYATSLDQVMGPDALPRLTADINAHLSELRGLARQMFGNFLEIARSGAYGKGSALGPLGPVAPGLQSSS